MCPGAKNVGSAGRRNGGGLGRGVCLDLGGLELGGKELVSFGNFFNLRLVSFELAESNIYIYIINPNNVGN